MLRVASEGYRFWVSSQRPDLSIRVRESSRMGHVDGQTVRSQQEAGTPSVLQVSQDAIGRDRQSRFPSNSHGKDSEEAKPRAKEIGCIKPPGKGMGHGRENSRGRCQAGIPAGGNPPDFGAGSLSDAAANWKPRGSSATDCRHAPEVDGEVRGTLSELQDPMVEHAFKTELEKPGTVNCEWLQDVFLDCQFVQDDATHLSLKRLIRSFRRELREVIAQRPKHQTRKPMQLLEVFCESDSQLTRQVRQLGGKAFRWSFEQGDLNMPQNRLKLFESLVEFDFEHVWCSPDCGPWCKWNQFNAARSNSLAEQIMEKRHAKLWQIALCVVICEFQQAQRKFFHWEQPQGSAMWFLHELKSLFEVGKLCCFDLCRVARLTVPMKPETFVKKGLAVLTNDELFMREFHNVRCLHDHDHQAIAGNISTENGRMPMSVWSGQYTRKFGRQVAQTLIRRRRLALLASPLLTADEPASKKARTEKQSSVNESKEPEQKRRRIVGKGGDGRTPPIPTSNHTENTLTPAVVSRESQINDMLIEAHKHAPRVGKKCLFEGEIMEKAQLLWPEMQIRVAVVSRGNRRYFPCPEQAHMGRNEAPSRLMICKGKLFSDIHVAAAWEDWERLVYQKAHKPCHPAKLSIMLFGKRQIPERQMPAEPTENACPPPISVQNNSNELTEKHVEESERLLQNSPKVSTVDLVNSQHGPLIQALDKREREWLVRVHQNLGHPGNDKLSQMLRQQDVKSHLCQAVADLRCAVCQEAKRPHVARSAAIHEPADFNEIVSIDGVTWSNKTGQSFYFYHCVDHATCFQMAKRALSTDSQGAIEAFDQAWLHWAGPPSRLTMDAGTELNSEVFQRFLQQNNIHAHTIARNAHWQNARAERHGGILQNILDKIDAETPITSEQQFDLALSHACTVKNQWTRHRGVSPRMLVFGKHQRMPGSIHSDLQESAHQSALDESHEAQQFQESLRFRTSAMSAFAKADNDQALRRALLHRSRPSRGWYNAGEWVMIWKPKGMNEGCWTGPMKVIMQESNQVVWVTMCEKLYRVAPEHIRALSGPEVKNDSLK